MRELKKNWPFYAPLPLVLFAALYPPLRAYAVGLALLAGAAAGNFLPVVRPPWLGKVRKLTLNTAVVLFGFGLNIAQVIAVGGQGFWQTAVSLAVVLATGFTLLRFFPLKPGTLKLITYGTSICGGSAIAAISSVMKSEDEQIGVSMGVVFLLNTVALFLFPVLARLLVLTPEQYGVWCALSIHDTSSVVGAASVLGDVSLSTATIMKLTRTLWITPLVFAISLRRGEKGKFSVPPFILLFLLASLVSSFVPLPRLWSLLSASGKVFMAAALYIVGFGLHRSVVRKAGKSGILFGLLLWGVSIVTGFLLATR